MKEEILTKIKKTKYCRICAYKRCVEWDTFLKVLLFLYNLIAIGCSIFSLIVPEKFQIYISMSIIVFTIFIFSLDLFKSIIDYSGNAEKYKTSYNTLERIINSIEETDDKEKIKECQRQYIEHINTSINHKQCDYNKAMFENYMEDEKKSCEEKKRIKRNYNNDRYRRDLLMTLLTFFLYPLYKICLLIVCLIYIICLFIAWLFERLFNKCAK